MICKRNPYRGFFRAGIKIQTMDFGILFDLVIKMSLRYLILTFLWTAIFNNQSSISVWDFQSFHKYIAAMVFATSLFSYPNIYFVSREIKTGNIVNALSKPYNYPLSIFMKNLGIVFFNFLLLSPVFFIYATVFSSASIKEWTLFLLSLILGSITYILFDINMALLTFWTESDWGISLLKNAIIFFFTGRLFPLDFLPSGIYHIFKKMPFAGMTYIPVLFFTGKENGMIGFYVLQLVWIIIFFITMQILFHKLEKNVNLNGG